MRIHKAIPWGPGLFFLAGGLLLLALEAAGIVPAAALARACSSDGILSDALIRRVSAGQRSMGWTLIAAALLAIVPRSCAGGVTVAVRRIPVAAFIGAAALFGGVFTAWAQCVLFDHMPHVTDAFSHLFQARLFAQGRMWAPVPPCPEHFFQYNTLMTLDGRWFTSYPPGHALLLAAFVRCGALLLYGPLMAALSIALFGWTVFRTFGRQAARLAVALAAASPLHVLLSASFMSHATAVVLLLGAAACAVAAYRRDAAGRAGSVWWILCGMLAGWAVLTRPQDAILAAPPVLWLLLALPADGRRRMLRGAFWVALGALPAAALQLGWNHLLYGRALTVGYGRVETGAFTPLLVPTFGFREGFTPMDALRQFLWSVQRFDQVLLGWPAAAAVALLGLVPRRTRVAAIACAVAVAANFALYFAYNYYGREYEARFFYPAAWPCIALVTVGLLDAQRRLVRALRTHGRAVWRLAVFALVAHSFLHYWPRYLVPLYGDDYEEVTPEPARLAESGRLQHALVLLPSDDEHAFLFSSGFWHNDADLTNAVLYARDLGPSRENCLREAFPTRAWYRYTPGSPGRMDPIVP